MQALASGTGPMAMRYVYHLTRDGAFFGPGSMFVFAAGMMLVASGCAYALPKDKADSRRSQLPSSTSRMFADFSEDAPTDDETAAFADSSMTPLYSESSQP